MKDGLRLRRNCIQKEKYVHKRENRQKELNMKREREGDKYEKRERRR